MRLLSLALALGLVTPSKSEARSRSPGGQEPTGSPPPEKQQRRRTERRTGLLVFAPLRSPCGRHVVEEDLLAALDSGHLAGATLDVFREEPLPPDSPFWTHPKVTLMPHCAALTRPETAARTVVDNIRRYLAGEPLRHVVDPARGY